MLMKGTSSFLAVVSTVYYNYSVLLSLSASSTATTDSILSTPGIKSLPFTPPCLLLERNNSSSYTFSDGLNHALSDQNLRLQQLVYEHKVYLF